MLKTRAAKLHQKKICEICIENSGDFLCTQTKSCIITVQCYKCFFKYDCKCCVCNNPVDVYRLLFRHSEPDYSLLDRIVNRLQQKSCTVGYKFFPITFILRKLFLDWILTGEQDYNEDYSLLLTHMETIYKNLLDNNTKDNKYSLEYFFSYIKEEKDALEDLQFKTVPSTLYSSDAAISIDQEDLSFKVRGELEYVSEINIYGKIFTFYYFSNNNCMGECGSMISPPHKVITKIVPSVSYKSTERTRKNEHQLNKLRFFSMLKYCTEPLSSAILSRDSSSDVCFCNKLSCKICNTIYCVNCLGKKSNCTTICEKITKITVKNIDKYKICPECKILIEKTSGCDSMWCTQCNTHFSWEFGVKNDTFVHNPDLYRKFDKYELSNMEITRNFITEVQLISLYMRKVHFMLLDCEIPIRSTFLPKLLQQALAQEIIYIHHPKRRSIWTGKKIATFCSLFRDYINYINPQQKFLYKWSVITYRNFEIRTSEEKIEYTIH